jgi:hypothetical protein
MPLRALAFRIAETTPAEPLVAALNGPVLVPAVAGSASGTLNGTRFLLG